MTEGARPESFCRGAALETMRAAAREAGAGLMRAFRERGGLSVREKGASDFVSSADLASEEAIRRALVRAYPTFGFVAEESAPTAGTDARARFIVDPLDGTTNFLHGIPHFAVAIALEHDGEVVCGVVFDPTTGEMFSAEAGRGAYLGDSPVHVSVETDLARSVVATGIPDRSRGNHAPYLEMLARVMREVSGIRRFAAAALDLAWVSAGRSEAFFELGLAPWDMAAGALLVREAGGAVSEPDGGAAFLRSGSVLATNGRLHPAMTTLLAGAAQPGA